MKEAAVLFLVLGGSVSSGFSGKPAPEIVAETVNMAGVCHRVEASEARNLKPRTIVWNLDGNYWRSYDRDCAAAVGAVRDFYVATAGVPKVMATVPDRNAGAFYRFLCGAETQEQRCRAPINQALADGCGKDCVLIDADEIFSRHKDEPDIHLTPAIWRAEAELFLRRQMGKR